MDDLISRQDAIDEIDEWIKAFRENGHKESAADACLIQDGIIQLPSAQPERKKGRWIKNDNGTYSCSICQSWIPEEQHHYARYCLYCGADMREG